MVSANSLALLQIFVINQLTSGTSVSPSFFANLRKLDDSPDFQASFHELVMLAIAEYIESKSVIKAGDTLVLRNKAANGTAAAATDAPTAMSYQGEANGTSAFANFDPNTVSRIQLGAGITAASLAKRVAAITAKPDSTNGYVINSDATLGNAMVAASITCASGNPGAQPNPTTSIPHIKSNKSDLKFTVLDSANDELEWVDAGTDATSGDFLTGAAKTGGLYATGTYTTASSGAGVGAIFTVTANAGATAYESIVVSTAGSGYVLGSILTLTSGTDILTLAALTAPDVYEINAQAKLWKSVKSKAVAVPATVRFDDLKSNDVRHGDLSGQSAVAGFGLDMTKTNAQVLTSLDAIHDSDNRANDLYDQLHKFTRNNYTLGQALQVSARDAATPANTAGSYTLTSGLRFKLSLMPNTPSYSAGLSGEHAKVREMMYRTNTPDTNSMFAGINNSVSRATAVTTYANMVRNNTAANITGASPHAIVVRTSPKATSANLHQYLEFIHSGIGKDYFADPVAAVKSDKENAFSPTSVSAIDFEELQSDGTWADAAAPVNIHAGALAVLLNRGSLSINKRPYVSSTSTVADIVDEITGLAGIAAYTPVALTSSTIEFSALGSTDVFSADNKIYKALAEIAAVKKTGAQTIDEYILASLLTTTITLNTLPNGASWPTVPDRDKISLRIMALWKASNTTAFAKTPKGALLEFTNTSNLQELSNRGYLRSIYDSATKKTNIYAIAPIFQADGAPNQFYDHDVVRKIALVKRLLAVLNIAKGPVSTRLIAASYTSDISPYGSAGDTSFTELTAIAKEAGSDQIIHIPHLAGVAAYQSARAKAVGVAGVALGQNDANKARYEASANLAAFFLSADAAWTDGTTQIPLDRQNLLRTHDRTELKQMVEDLVNVGGTMDANGRKLIGDILYYAPGVIASINIDADEFAAISSEWHQNSALAIASRPVMYDVTNSAITAGNAKLWFATAQNNAAVTAVAKGAAAHLLKFMQHPLIDTEDRMRACFDFAVADNDYEALVGMVALAGLDVDKKHASLDETKRMIAYGVIESMMNAAALYNVDNEGLYAYAAGVLNAIVMHDWKNAVNQ